LRRPGHHAQKESRRIAASHLAIPSKHRKDGRLNAQVCATAPSCHIKKRLETTEIVAGIRVPDSAMARAATQLVRDTEDDLLCNHSRRVFFGGVLTGNRRGLKYDPELLYVGAMFHDMGLTKAHASADLRFGW
jgi:hypothetical protein